MGVSVMAATLSTAGSVSALFFTVIVFFSRFGMLLCALMLIALLYANLFLAPLLLLFGPRSAERARTRDEPAPARTATEPAAAEGAVELTRTGGGGREEGDGGQASSGEPSAGCV